MELLSPAGDFDALIAAVQNGADAVYLGSGDFNARKSAANFDGENLDKAVRYCHLRGVKVHVTVNTLVRTDEYDKLRRTIERVYMSGADAMIIQDLGVTEFAKSIAPDMELHASTQMAIHNYQGVDFAKSRGFSRVVLARELSFSEIAECTGRGVDIEVFGHGALCVSCSGQCLMSSMIGGRSGNRGSCAQPCRMLYQMGDKDGYLLSTKDLMTADIVKKLSDIGVKSIKLEGRLKRAEYVAIVTRVYRRALDGEKISRDDIDELKQIFNRGGFTNSYLTGLDDKELMYSSRSNNIGLPVGKCLKPNEILLEKDISQADTLSVNDDNSVRLSGKSGETVRLSGVKRGDILVRLASDNQLKSARESLNAEYRKRGVSVKLIAKVGSESSMEAVCGKYFAESRGGIVSAAQSRPADIPRIEAQIRKTGGTAFEIDSIDADIDSNAFLSMSDINALRRLALDGLENEICRVRRVSGSYSYDKEPSFAPNKPALRAQSGDVTALKLALKSGADEIVFSPTDMRSLDAALELDKFYFCVPEVARADELNAINDWVNAHSDKIMGVYISNAAHLSMKWTGRVIIDHAMNIAGDAALSSVKCDEFTPSLELTSRQIDALGGVKDIVVYGYVPVMRLRHCPNRVRLSLTGKHSSCRLCDNGGGIPPLIDRTGAEFPLQRVAFESGCVIRLLNSVPYNLIRRVHELPKANAWRIIVDKNDAIAAAKVFRAAIDNIDYTKCPEWTDICNMKFTAGHYFRGVE